MRIHSCSRARFPVITTREYIRFMSSTFRLSSFQSSVGKKMATGTFTHSFLAHENFNNVHKKVQKGYKIFKPTIHNVLITGTNIVKIWLSLCLIRGVRFARYCGKMYSRHLFSYGGFVLEFHVSVKLSFLSRTLRHSYALNVLWS